MTDQEVCEAVLESLSGSQSYPYSNASLQRFDTLHRDWQLILSVLQTWVDHTIIEGHRPREQQRAVFEAGLSKVDWPNSKHNTIPSMAVDVAPWVRELRRVEWEDHYAICRLWGMIDLIAKQLLAASLITHRVRWGGDWDMDGRSKDQKFMDLVHGELVPAEQPEHL